MIASSVDQCTRTEVRNLISSHHWTTRREARKYAVTRWSITCESINPDLPIFIQMEMEARSGVMCIGRSGNVRIEFIIRVLHHLVSSSKCHSNTGGCAFDVDLHGNRGFPLGNEGFPWETPMNPSARF
ncbi:MAG: hypothetical protein DRP71_05370 [Verrucomicrobia bacterium]|nr:MAG: hypothetical protein DRP71_05370 [Verrucomicrobiota bacterium]